MDNNLYLNNNLNIKDKYNKYYNNNNRNINYTVKSNNIYNNKYNANTLNNTDKRSKINSLKYQISLLESQNSILSKKVKEKELQIINKRNELKSLECIRSNIYCNNNACNTNEEEDNILQQIVDIELNDPIREYEDNIINEICPNPDAMSDEQLMELSDQIGYVSKGLSKDQIFKLGTKIYKANNINSKLYNHLNINKSKHVNNNDKCMICLDEFCNNEKIREFKCKHCFHITCIDDWLIKDKTCPLCKKEVI